MRLVLLLNLLCIAAIARSQSLDKTVIANGGNVMSNAQINLNCTLGEPIVGQIKEEFTIDQGFWASGLAVEPLQTKDEQGGIVVYPNPVEEALNVFTNNERVVGITLFSVNGKRVWKERVEASQREHHINVTHLSKGTYVLRLFIEGNSTEKLFKIIKK